MTTYHMTAGLLTFTLLITFIIMYIYLITFNCHYTRDSVSVWLIRKLLRCWDLTKAIKNKKHKQKSIEFTLIPVYLKYSHPTYVCCQKYASLHFHMKNRPNIAENHVQLNFYPNDHTHICIINHCFAKYYHVYIKVIENIRTVKHSNFTFHGIL